MFCWPDPLPVAHRAVRGPGHLLFQHRQGWGVGDPVVELIWGLQRQCLRGCVRGQLLPSDYQEERGQREGPGRQGREQN